MQKEAIQIEGITKTFPRRDRPALAGISLTVPTGQIVAFLGPNGAGKTTSIKIMCGLIAPDEGRVLLNGFDVTRNRSQVMRQIGVVLEGTRNIYWRLSAWQNLHHFAYRKGCFGKDVDKRAEALLRDLDLWDHRNAPVRTFSRGMQQKVAVACALVTDAPLVLLDEPTLGLDVQSARTLKHWVSELSRTRRKTILITTHQLDLAQTLCDRVVILNQGRLITDKPTDELIRLSGKPGYRVRVTGSAERYTGLWEDMHVETAVADGNGQSAETVFSLPVPVELYLLLERLKQMDAELIEVIKDQPTLEDVFVKLTRKEMKE